MDLKEKQRKIYSFSCVGKDLHKAQTELYKWLEQYGDIHLKPKEKETFFTIVNRIRYKEDYLSDMVMQIASRDITPKERNAELSDEENNQENENK
jgi:hypothetical protein